MRGVCIDKLSLLHFGHNRTVIQTYGNISFKFCYFQIKSKGFLTPAEGSGNKLNRARTENRPRQNRDLAAPCQEIRVHCSRSLTGLRTEDQVRKVL